LSTARTSCRKVAKTWVIPFLLGQILSFWLSTKGFNGMEIFKIKKGSKSTNLDIRV